jgi:hypothetical protein
VQTWSRNFGRDPGLIICKIFVDGAPEATVFTTAELGSLALGGYRAPFVCTAARIGIFAGNFPWGIHVHMIVNAEKPFECIETAWGGACCSTDHEMSTS